MPGTLQLCPMPIGYVGDISLRVLHSLRLAPLVLVEHEKNYRRFLSAANRYLREFLHTLPLNSIGPEIENLRYFEDYNFFAILEINEKSDQSEIDSILQYWEKFNLAELAEILFKFRKRSDGLQIEDLQIEFSKRMSSYQSLNTAASQVEKADHKAEFIPLYYVSDSGSPFLEDPGMRLASIVKERGWNIEAFPGPSALITALGYLGQKIDGFIFEGFLPRESQARKKMLSSWAKQARVTKPILFYETPYRMSKLIAELTDIKDDLYISLAAELSTNEEQIWQGSIRQLIKEKLNLIEKYNKKNTVILFSS